MTNLKSFRKSASVNFLFLFQLPPLLPPEIKSKKERGNREMTNSYLSLVIKENEDKGGSL